MLHNYLLAQTCRLQFGASRCLSLPAFHPSPSRPPACPPVRVRGETKPSRGEPSTGKTGMAPVRCCLPSLVDISMPVIDTIDTPPTHGEPQAHTALQKESGGLRAHGLEGCWDEHNPHEKLDVKKNTMKLTRRHTQKDLRHLCGEELPPSGRNTIPGEQRQGSRGELGNLPRASPSLSTMPATTIADFYLWLEDHSGEQADAEMAYTQAPNARFHVCPHSPTLSQREHFGCAEAIPTRLTFRPL